MTPTFVTDQDGHRRRVDEHSVGVILDVRRVVVRHSEVSLYDIDGRESILIQHGSVPGAGMIVDFGDHVEVSK